LTLWQVSINVKGLDVLPAGSVDPISVWIPGDPVAQPRPRARATGRGVYDDGRADPWKDRVRMMAAAAVQGAQAGSWPIRGPVAVELEFRATRSPIARPDADNLAKAVLDALGPGRAGSDTSRGRGRWAPLLWHDDAQVTDLVVRKRQGEPGLRMTVRRVTT
jgi:Holliday junction resolvase RusA-like endonuclease